MTAAMTVLPPPRPSLPAATTEPLTGSDNGRAVAAPRAPGEASAATEATVIDAQTVSVFYGQFEAIKKVSLSIPAVGPSPASFRSAPASWAKTK